MCQKNNKSHEVRMIVPFHDVDSMQIVWHGNYMKYFDITRFSLFKKADIDLYELYKESQYILPITRSSVKYIIPLCHNDEFICKACVLQAKAKIVMDFEIRLVKNGKLSTKGSSEQVAVKMPEKEIMFEIPKEISKPLGF